MTDNGELEEIVRVSEFEINRGLRCPPGRFGWPQSDQKRAVTNSG